MGKSTKTELVIRDHCFVYVDDVLRSPGERVSVSAADAAALIEQGVAADPAAPAADEDDPLEGQPPA